MIVIAPVVVVASMESATAAGKPVFEKDVLPIFTRYCFNCHGKSSPQLGLDLRTARLAMRGSQNGPVIIPGSPKKSLLWKKISTREMPLAQFKLKLSKSDRRLNIGHAIVVTQLIMNKPPLIGVKQITCFLQAFGPFTIVGKCHAAFSGGNNFIGIKTES